MKDPLDREQFLQNHLPPKFLKLFSSTKPYPNSFVDKRMRKYESDLVLFNEQENTMLYILIEHQSSIDHRIEFRVQQYVMRILEDFVHKNKKNNKKLPFIFPIVVYAGKEKYTAAKMLWEICEYPELQREV